ncbi:MarR family winged helix-turn-helix transcriptional regulator [Novosphingobium sp.]|uniref:MarR family winged helix-turn-helix transcriptional regulator n=1 Tax=Novosphingobium sp. TaxID=1874826 RepID=UPI002B48A40C|nr:MarR family winged helix-turn-helix transcriptional regulator [Novosphingobium sp.]HKR93512.1 MarR family winged helix-turn-helix transcriptional regulator [Novosphingobium sp.]
MRSNDEALLDPSAGIDNTVSISEVEYSIISLTSSLGFLLHATYLQLRDLLRLSSEFGLKPSMFELMRITSENPGIRQAHASRILLLQESNTTILVKELQNLGLMERAEPGKKKRPGLWLTKLGEAKFVEVTKIAQCIEREHTASLPDAEVSKLRTLLSTIYRDGLLRSLANDVQKGAAS